MTPGGQSASGGQPATGGQATSGGQPLSRGLRAPRPADDAAVDVLGLGQNSVDHLCRVASYPAAGTKTEARRYELLPGGQVATAVLAAHRLGLRTRYWGAVGDDAMGPRACEVLAADGVELQLKVVEGARTQFSMIIVDDSGERTIVEHYDPRTVITTEDIRPEPIAEARALHLDITDVPAAIRAARIAREAGTLVSLDIDRLLPGTEELLSLVDFLVASEGLPQELGSPDPRMALFTLRKLCPGVVCITAGERGCVGLDRDEAFYVPAFKVPVADTTGCGDVFRGAALYGLLQRWDLMRALRFASAAAALQAGTLGAQAGVPRLAEVERFLASDPPVHQRKAGARG